MKLLKGFTLISGFTVAMNSYAIDATRCPMSYKVVVENVQALKYAGPFGQVYTFDKDSAGQPLSDLGSLNYFYRDPADLSIDSFVLLDTKDSSACTYMALTRSVAYARVIDGPDGGSVEPIKNWVFKIKIYSENVTMFGGVRGEKNLVSGRLSFEQGNANYQFNIVPTVIGVSTRNRYFEAVGVKSQLSINGILNGAFKDIPVATTSLNLIPITQTN